MDKTQQKEVVPQEIIIPKGNIFAKAAYLMGTVGAGAILMSINMGPGTATSCVSAGASYGYSLLWLVLMSGVMGGIISYLGGKVTAVTGKTILENMRDANKYISSAIMLLILVTYYRLILIQGSTLKHLTDIIVGQKASIPVFLITILAMAYIFTSGKDNAIKIASLMCTAMAVVFVFNIFWAKPDPVGMLSGMIPSIPKTGKEAKMFAGIIGGAATGLVGMMYSSSAKDSCYTKPKYLKNMIVDQSYFSLLFALYSAGIFISGAAVLKPAGIVVKSALDASSVLEPLAGPIGKWIFIFGLWAAVFTTIGGLGSLTAYVFASLFRTGDSMNDKSFKLSVAGAILLGFLGAFVKAPALPNLIGGTGSLNIVGAILTIAILYVTNSKKLMGEYKNKPFLNVLGGFVLLLNLYSAYGVLFAK